MNITGEIEANSKLRGLFFLKVLYHLSIEMRALLTENPVPYDKIRIINEMNHRLLPPIGAVVSNPEASMPNHIGKLVEMLCKTGFLGMMETALGECQREIMGETTD